MEWTRIAELTPCPTHHLLILDGLIPAARLCPYGLRPSKPERSLCLHALSSFQRTSRVPDARSARPAALPPTTTGRLQANLPRLREGSQSVNPSSSRVRGFAQPREANRRGERFLGKKNLLSDFSRSKLSAAYLLGSSAASCLAANVEPAGHAQTGNNYTRRCPTLSTPGVLLTPAHP